MLRTMHIPQNACENNAHSADQCYLRTLRNERNALSAKSSLNVVVREGAAVLQLLAGEDSQQSKVLPIKVFRKICRPPQRRAAQTWMQQHVTPIHGFHKNEPIHLSHGIPHRHAFILNICKPSHSQTQFEKCHTLIGNIPQ